MTKKSHTHRLQTNPWHCEEDPQNTDSHITAKAKFFLSKIITKPEKSLRPDHKMDPTQKRAKPLKH